MDAGLIAFIAGMIGLLVGVLSMNAVARSERERERSLVSAPTLRDGAAQVLAVIGRAYLVIDEVGGVVQASPGAYAMGLVRGHTVTSPELADMIRTVRHRGIFAEQSFEIDRGEGEALVLDVRVASLGDEYILVLADDYVTKPYSLWVVCTRRRVASPRWCATSLNSPVCSRPT